MVLAFTYESGPGVAVRAGEVEVVCVDDCEGSELKELEGVLNDWAELASDESKRTGSTFCRRIWPCATFSVVPVRPPGMSFLASVAVSCVFGTNGKCNGSAR